MRVRTQPNIDAMNSHGGTGVTEGYAVYSALTVIRSSRKDAKSAKKNFDWEGEDSMERQPVLHGHTPGITTAHIVPRSWEGQHSLAGLLQLLFLFALFASLRETVLQGRFTHHRKPIRVLRAFA